MLGTKWMAKLIIRTMSRCFAMGGKGGFNSSTSLKLQDDVEGGKGGGGGCGNSAGDGRLIEDSYLGG